MTFSRIKLLIGAVALGMMATANVLADPVSFSNVVALQNGGATRVDLLSNPNTTLFGSPINFLVDIVGATPASGTNTLLLSFNELGQAPVIQSFLVPLFAGLPPDYTLLFSFRAQNPSFQGVPVVLTVSLISGPPTDLGGTLNSHTYTFNVANPVPEPATSTLFILGLAGAVARLRRRKPDTL